MAPLVGLDRSRQKRTQSYYTFSRIWRVKVRVNSVLEGGLVQRVLLCGRWALSYGRMAIWPFASASYSFSSLISKERE